MAEKRDQLLETAQELFFRHGVRRVTVEEICTKAGISKMTYYKYFSNKWDIAKILLDKQFNEGNAAFLAGMEMDIPFTEKIEMLLMHTTERIRSVGAAFLEDLLNKKLPLYNYFMEKQKASRELSVAFFNQAKKEGHIRKDINIPVLLFMLERLSDMINDPQFIKIMPNIEDRAYEITALFFHGYARLPEKGP